MQTDNFELWVYNSTYFISKKRKTPHILFLLRQKHQKGALLQIIYQKGVILQLFPGGGLFFYCKAPPTQAPPLCTWHVAQGGSAPDAGVFGSAQGSGTTGGAPAAGATASAGQPGACPPPQHLLLTPLSLFPHPPTPKFYIFYIVYQKFKFCFIFLISIICYFFIFPHPHPKISIRLFFIHSKLYIF